MTKIGRSKFLASAVLCALAVSGITACSGVAGCYPNTQKYAQSEVFFEAAIGQDLQRDEEEACNSENIRGFYVENMTDKDRMAVRSRLDSVSQCRRVGAVAGAGTEWTYECEVQRVRWFVVSQPSSWVTVYPEPDDAAAAS